MWECESLSTCVGKLVNERGYHCSIMNFAWEELVKYHFGLNGPGHVLHLAILSFVFYQYIVQVSFVVSSVQQQPKYEVKTTKNGTVIQNSFNSHCYME